jgi:hypothetical protein
MTKHTEHIYLHARMRKVLLHAYACGTGLHMPAWACCCTPSHARLLLLSHAAC